MSTLKISGQYHNFNNGCPFDEGDYKQVSNMLSEFKKFSPDPVFAATIYMEPNSAKTTGNPGSNAVTADACNYTGTVFTSDYTVAQKMVGQSQEAYYTTTSDIKQRYIKLNLEGPVLN